MITKLELGRQNVGYHGDLYIVRDIYNGEATVYIYAGDAHRVERMSVEACIEMLNALDNIDTYDPDYEEKLRVQDKYWSVEHPERRVVAMWPDDCDCDEEWNKHIDYCNGDIVDIETGEVYDEILV